MPESITLYGFGDDDRSGKVRWTARELGLEIEEVGVRPGDNRKPPYTELNPFAHIPTVKFRGEILTESTAICHTLAEAFDEPKLWVARGEPERRAYLFWLAAFGETLEARLVECAVSRAGILGPEYFALHEKGLRFKLGVVAERLPREGYLCGERFSVADVLGGYSLRLAVQCGLIERAKVEPYLGRLVARPAAVQSRVFASLAA
ncbi:MAG: glutathione S-transferase family protein [Myxococcales bacterium]|nr:glutathione S-transferase family protein [Myxococcales bacterium]